MNTTASNILPTQSPLTCVAPRCIKGVQSTILATFLSLAFLTVATAADFSGSLKGVSITDAQSTNKAPVATFTHTQNGDIITFDASGSSDPDGSITKYKWVFDNGTIAEGATTNYIVIGSAKIQATLTVIDNNNAVALTQQIIPITPKGLSDDFSTDTSTDYTILTGGLKISGGAAHSSGAWTTTYAIHNTELPSNDHSVDANVYYNGSSGTSGLLFRYNKKLATGYSVWFASGRIILNSYNTGTEKFIAFFDGKYTAGIYKLRAVVSAGLIKIYVNENLVMEKTDNTYSAGNQIGFKISPYGDDTSVTVDNLIGR